MQQTERGLVIPFMRDGSFFYKKGLESYENKRITKAIRHMKRAIEIEPEEPVFACQLAIILAEEGDYATSNSWLRKIKDDIDPSMPESYFFLANNLAHLGEFTEAREHLKTYQRLDAEGEFSEDAEMLLSLIGSTEDNADANPFTMPVMSALHIGDFELAEKEARAMITTNPREWLHYVYVAESLLHQGELKEADQTLQDVLTKVGDHVLARAVYTTLLVENGDEAADELVRGLRLAVPMDSFHMYMVGRALYFASEFEASYQLLQKCIPRTNAVYLHQLAVVAARTGRFEVAAKLWDQAATLHAEYKPDFKAFEERARSQEYASEHKVEWHLRRI
ncbi:tetratricopeptide repeat protein [Paenalkalicoccus suaedae]|uniref:Tetratricopeptide repeat protein n=1 Tax=Paenalkalicoccus suaedae TaxID=2592382 RepID=A0A859FHV5_9BACI|nr:tetratricopeptide repeat protein [Paenalkalicoccus suaedae]QKS72254.1 tetratricopeptide repeat protein [Paenalkalicoccus suaedae]